MAAGRLEWVHPFTKPLGTGHPTRSLTKVLAVGTWRTLPTFDGRTAADVARRRGHVHRLELLETPKPLAEPDHIALWTVARTNWCHNALPISGCARRAATSAHPVLRELGQGQGMWFPIPGMYARRADRDLTSVSCDVARRNSGEASPIRNTSILTRRPHSATIRSCRAHGVCGRVRCPGVGRRRLAGLRDGVRSVTDLRHRTSSSRTPDHRPWRPAWRIYPGDEPIRRSRYPCRRKREETAPQPLKLRT